MNSVASPTFSEDEKEKLSDDLTKEMNTAQHWADYNQGYLVKFKIFLLILGVLAVSGTGYATMFADGAAPGWLRASNVIISGIITLVSGFAFSDFNFAERHATYQKKSDTLRSYITILRYSNPEKSSFLLNYDEILRWSNSVKPTELKPIRFI